MDFKLLKKIYSRSAKELRKLEITHPAYACGKEKLIYTDGHTALVVPSAWGIGDRKALESATPISDVKYDRIVNAFSGDKAETSSYRTTVRNLKDWLRYGTDGCPLCDGTALCVPLPNGLDDTTPEQEDALSLHYAWIGAVPVDRRRIEEYLYTLPDVHDTDEIMITAHVRSEHDHGVCVLASEWVIYSMGRCERREAAPKFHIEGKYEDPVFKAKKRK